jgi:hypothetical protein
MEELKKCPFCGCEPRKITTRKEGDLAELSRVFCANVLCPIQPATRRRFTMEEAVKDWNGRADI